MATREMAKMLDELMGRNRDARPGDKIENLTWEDPSVCRYFLTDICPHELFTNTKADLGGCPRLHDDVVKEEFRRVKDYKLKSPVYNEYIRLCQKLFTDLENKIKRSKARLVLSQMEQAASQGISKKQQEEIESKIQILTDKVNGLVDQAEKAGVEGDVEKATGLLKLVDTLREERNQLKVQIGMAPAAGQVRPGAAATELHHKFEVCEVCGAILVADDKTARRDDHLMGKQHVGYVRLKGSLERISAEQTKMREERERERLAEDVKEEGEENGEIKEDGCQEREKGEISPNHADKPERKRDKKSKDRKRSRSRERKRSRSKERRRRSKSRDRRRSKSRDRRRSRSKDRRRDRSRDRSRDRRRR